MVLICWLSKSFTYSTSTEWGTPQVIISTFVCIGTGEPPDMKILSEFCLQTSKTVFQWRSIFHSEGSHIQLIFCFMPDELFNWDNSHFITHMTWTMIGTMESYFVQYGFYVVVLRWNSLQCRAKIVPKFWIHKSWEQRIRSQWNFYFRLGTNGKYFHCILFSNQNRVNIFSSINF